MAAERNLVLVHTKRMQARSDFETIREKIAERAPDIEVFIVENHARNSVARRQAARRPSLVFSPVQLAEFSPARGTLYSGRPYSKTDELRMMRAAGISVPQTVFVQPDTALDTAEWGPFMVVKPTRGMQGRGVRLWRTKHVRWVDPWSWPRDDERYGRDLMAQRFVDTGAHTTHFRVSVVLGRCVYSSMSRALEPRPFALDPEGDDRLDVPIAANVGERTITLNFDRDVIAFGESVHRAFPDVAVLGVDVIREESTGRLFVLEVNSPGLTWHISSAFGLGLQRKYGIDLPNQFGALDIVADALVERTRAEAA